jgi:hypothetical protein
MIGYRPPTTMRHMQQIELVGRTVTINRPRLSCMRSPHRLAIRSRCRCHEQRPHRFSRAPGGRGRLVTAIIAYDPPAGSVGKLIAKLFQREPKIQARRDLRRFKQFMETGEIATSRSGCEH